MYQVCTYRHQLVIADIVQAIYVAALAVHVLIHIGNKYLHACLFVQYAYTTHYFMNQGWQKVQRDGRGGKRSSADEYFKY